MDKYREFDTESTSTSATTTLSFKRFNFTRREMVLGIVVLLCLLVIIVLAALLATANSKGSNDDSPNSSAVNRTDDGHHQSTTPKPDQIICPKDTGCYTTPCLRAASHAMELLNRSEAKPCDDFYQFACGNFQRLHPLDPDESQVTTFGLVHRQNLDKLRRVVESFPKNEAPEHYEAKVKGFYSSCMDHFQRTAAKGNPFVDKVLGQSGGGWWVLKGDQNWPGDYSFQQQLEKVHVELWTDVFFTFEVWPDWLDWNKATVEIHLGMSLGLDWWAYKHEPEKVTVYKDYMKKVGRLLIRDAQLELEEEEEDRRLNTFVSDALFVEAELGRILETSAFETDPHAHENRLKLADLNRMSKGEIDWVSLFKHMFNTGKTPVVSNETYMVVWEQEYIANFTTWMSQLDSSNKSRILNNYMVWQLADRYSRFLSWEYMHLYYSVKMISSDNVEIPPAWLACLSQLDYGMEDAMGALFVKDHFSDANRKMAYNVTDFIKQALLDSMDSVSHWMSFATRLTAKNKLKESLIKLGYPKFMLNEGTLNRKYSHLTIDKDDYFGNILSFFGHYRNLYVNYYVNASDRSVWVYPPYLMQVEYYSPWKELIIPAGMLQFPVFHFQSPGYMNFGSMGSIVGRELTHAIDETGNQYNLNGSHFGEWWSRSTTNTYKVVRGCMIEAYKNYRMKPFEGVPWMNNYNHVPDMYAPYALSESTGVQLAFKAYQKWSDQLGPEGTIPGHNFTNNQMFFISYAQSYCSNRHPSTEFMDLMYSSHHHVTDRVRVDGALSQLDEFKTAFGCMDNSNMVNPKKCRLY